MSDPKVPRWMSRLRCLFVGHAYFVRERFSATHRRVGCRRCHGDWGMEDHTRSFIPWDDELADLIDSCQAVSDE